MTTAFNAQPIIELKPRDKSKIETVLAYGDRIFVGLSTGSLRVYRVSEPQASAQNGKDRDADAAESKKPERLTDLLSEEDKFSKRAVQQLSIIKEANVLVALTDNHVSLYDLQTYALHEKLDKTRGATLFAVTSNVDKDGEAGIPTLVSRLAVAVKRKILLWSWHDMELDADVQELALPHTVKSLTWVTGSKVMVGLDAGFTLIDIGSSEMTEITKPVSAAETGGQTSVRFGAVSSSGMGYMGMSGWVPKPMCARLSENNLLLAKDVNTLFVDENGQALERRQIPWAAAPEVIGFSYPFLLSLQPPAKGVLEIRNPETLTLLQTIPVAGASTIHVPQPNISLAHAGKGFLVASDRVVWRMQATSYESQAADLVNQARFDEATSLLSMLEDTLLKDKPMQIREVQIQKAMSLFAQKKFRPALDLFTDSGAPPIRVIALYPPSIAAENSNQSAAHKPSAQNTDAAASPSREGSIKSPSKTKAGKSKSSTKESDAASIRSNATSKVAKPPNEQVSGMPLLDGPDLKPAVLALCSFLAQSRVQVQKHLDFDGVLKVPLSPKLSDENPDVPFRNLIVVPDGTHIKDVPWQDELYKVAQLVDTTLFRSYMFALPSLAGPLFRLDNFCDPDVVEEKLYENGRYNDLIDFLQGKKLHKQALDLLEQFGQNKAEEEVMPALRGPNRTIAYLQQLPAELIDTILTYSKWPLEACPDAAMEIFLADSENAENLPRDRIVEHLDSTNSDLSLRYLEHIINELNDQTPTFHQSLIDKYLLKLKSPLPAPETTLYQTRLETLLRSSTQYNRGKTFRALPIDNPLFHESRALVLSAMGNHKQALALYVFSMSAPDKAESYCNELYLRSPTEHADIYTALLGLYLRPPPGEQVRFGPALALLAAHGARVPASATLDLLPDDVSVRDLQAYFSRRMRRDVSARRTLAVEKGLREVVLADEEAGLGAAKGRKVRVGEDDHCRVCLRRFGSSAVRVWPDGIVCHYGCARGQGQGQGRRKSGLAATGGGFEGMAKAGWN